MAKRKGMPFSRLYTLGKGKAKAAGLVYLALLDMAAAKGSKTLYFTRQVLCDHSCISRPDTITEALTLLAKAGFLKRCKDVWQYRNRLRVAIIIHIRLKHVPALNPKNGSKRNGTPTAKDYCSREKQAISPPLDPKNADTLLRKGDALNAVTPDGVPPSAPMKPAEVQDLLTGRQKEPAVLLRQERAAHGH